MNQLDYPNLRLLLVDNGSIDDTHQMVAQNFPDVEIIVNEKNLGFAGGFNVGLRYALSQQADYVLMLNNDTEIDSMALYHMLEQAAPDVGMIAPKIYYYDDPARIWSVGGNCHPLTIEQTDDARGQLDTGQWNVVLERDFFTGCALLVSRQFLIKVGLFDEQFFMYYEDADWSFRARRDGFKLLLAPQAHVWHKVAISSGGSDSPNERYWMARSSVLYFSKHARLYQIPFILFWRLSSAIRTSWRLVRQSKWNAFKAYWRGLWHGVRKRPL